MVCVHVGDNVLWVVFDGVGIVVVISIGRPATDVERGCVGALVLRSYLKMRVVGWLVMTFPCYV